MEVTPETELHELAQGERVFLVFQILHLDHSFLQRDPTSWNEESSFQRLAKFVKNFRVVNDVAEHAIQLVTDYNEKVTRSEIQRQYLYATVNAQRRERSDLRRKSLQPSFSAKTTQPPKDRSEYQRQAKML